MTPSLDRLTSGKSGTGSAAAAISAAIFGPASAASIGPAGGFANIYKGQGRGTLVFLGNFGKQRRFLRAADDDRLALRDGGAEPVDLGAAQMMRGRDLCATTATPHRLRVERHRVFARADQDLRAFRHLVFNLVQPVLITNLKRK